MEAIIWETPERLTGKMGAGTVPAPLAKISVDGAPMMMAAGSLGKCSQISVVRVAGSGVRPLSERTMGPRLV